ncbi:hypothetical protein ACNOYE_11855 [Nannocystaceae bacterium ST9]
MVEVRRSRLLAALDHEGGTWLEASSEANSRALAELRGLPAAASRGFVLRLVEAALLSGADEVHVDCVEGVVMVELGPLQLARDELSQLFTHARPEQAPDSYRHDADAQPSARARTLHMLALACAAALEQAPKSIELDRTGKVQRWPIVGILIDSIARSGAGQRWLATPERPAGVVQEIEGERPGTRIEIGGVIGEHDRELLRERCRASQHPIFIDGERISEGPEVAMLGGFVELRQRGGWSPAIQTRPLIDAQGRVLGQVGHTREPGVHVARLIVLCNGVEIESIELPEGRSRFVAVVELDLPRDLAQIRLQRGAELEAVLGLVSERARARHRPASAREPEFRIEPLPEDPGVGANVAILRVIVTALGLIALVLYQLLTSK